MTNHRVGTREGWLAARKELLARESEHTHRGVLAYHFMFGPQFEVAIDWSREIDGSFFTGDGTKLSDYVCYGAAIHAVANGTVVTAIFGIQDSPNILESNSLPFEIGSFTVQGTGGLGSKPGTVTVTG